MSVLKYTNDLFFLIMILFFLMCFTVRIKKYMCVPI